MRNHIEGIVRHSLGRSTLAQFKKLWQTITPASGVEMETNYRAVHFPRRTIRHTQEMFRDLYGERNRVLSHWPQLCLRLSEELGHLAEAVRTNTLTGDAKAPLERSIGGVGARIFAIANWFDWDLAEVVYAKYHNVCPYCSRSDDCGCPEASHGKRLRTEIDPHLFEFTLGKTQSMFERIYEKTNAERGASDTFLHLVEEHGELVNALRNRDLPGAREELADVFAWWMAYASLVCDRSIAHILFEIYQDRCPRCGHTPCPVDGTCPPF